MSKFRYHSPFHRFPDDAEGQDSSLGVWALYPGLSSERLVGVGLSPCRLCCPSLMKPEGGENIGASE